LHIYPDEHMELALSRKLEGQARIPIVETTHWLYEKYRNELVGYEQAYELRDVLAKVTKQAWIQYGIEDVGDMRGYMYLYFIVASDFDKNVEVAKILKDPNRNPGDFGRAVAALSEEKIARIKASGKPPGEKNVQ